MQAVNKTQVKARETGEKIIAVNKKPSFLSNVLSNVKKALLSDITVYRADSYHNDSHNIDSFVNGDNSISLEAKKAKLTANIKTQTINR